MIGKVGIIGAGIGGLAAALGMLRKGIDVDVYEQAPDLKEVGAGVQITPNGSRVLLAYGLEDAIRAIGTPTAGKDTYLWNTGQKRPFMKLGDHASTHYGAPYLTFHRADLHSLLLAAVRALKPVPSSWASDASRSSRKATACGCCSPMAARPAPRS